MKAEVNFTFSFTFRKQVFIKLHTFYRRTKKNLFLSSQLLYRKDFFILTA